MMSLNTFRAKAILIDITGVLYESGTDCAIAGSIDAIRKLRQSRLPFKFVTNETQNTTSGLASKLNRFGFDVTADEIFAPAPAVRRYLNEHGLRPHYLIHPGVEAEFEGIRASSEPNCVVLGDAAERFSYENVNTAFSVLMKNKETKLISMGKGRYYQENGRLVMDLGAFATGLEYACDVRAIVIGKPSEQFYSSALDLLGGIEAQDAVMIGDDILGDVEGSQKMGMKGILVKTGKFRAGRDDQHPRVKPDAIVENLETAIKSILSNS